MTQKTNSLFDAVIINNTVLLYLYLQHGFESAVNSFEQEGRVGKDPTSFSVEMAA